MASKQIKAIRNNKDHPNKANLKKMDKMISKNSSILDKLEEADVRTKPVFHCVRKEKDDKSCRTLLTRDGFCSSCKVFPSEKEEMKDE